MSGPLTTLIAEAESDIGTVMVLSALIEDADDIEEVRDWIAEQDINLQQIAMTIRLLINATNVKP